MIAAPEVREHGCEMQSSGNGMALTNQNLEQLWSLSLTLHQALKNQ